jgi:hypothetical protein
MRPSTCSCVGASATSPLRHARRHARYRRVTDRTAGRLRSADQRISGQLADIDQRSATWSGACGRRHPAPPCAEHRAGDHDRDHDEQQPAKHCAYGVPYLVARHYDVTSVAPVDVATPSVSRLQPLRRRLGVGSCSARRASSRDYPGQVGCRGRIAVAQRAATSTAAPSLPVRLHAV